MARETELEDFVKKATERAGKSVREISNGFEETVDDILDGKKNN